MTDHHLDNTPHTRAVSNSSMDPFRAYTTPQTQPPFNPSAYNATARFSPPPSTQPQPYTSPVPEPQALSSYYTPQVQSAAPPSQSRSYTLGGGGYGENTLSALPDPRASDNSGGYLPYPGTPSTGSVYTGLESPPAGRLPSPELYEDSPPTYDEGFRAGAGTSHTPSAPRKR